MPTSRCRRTTSWTAWVIVRAAPAGSATSPFSRPKITSVTACVRGRLPTCVVRMRSVLVLMGLNSPGRSTLREAHSMSETSERSEFLVISRGQWDPALSRDEIQGAIDRFYVWIEQLVADGRMKRGQRLGDGGRTVARNLVTDGPFGEAKEVIGGYWSHRGVDPRRGRAARGRQPVPRLRIVLRDPAGRGATRQRVQRAGGVAARAPTTMSRQGGLALLQEPVAKALLQSTQPAHLAYVARDGTPRVVPVWFHWTGRALVVGSPPTSPKVQALTPTAPVAVSIDTATLAVPGAADQGRGARRQRAWSRAGVRTGGRAVLRCGAGQGLGRADRRDVREHGAHLRRARMGRPARFRVAFSGCDRGG